MTGSTVVIRLRAYRGSQSDTAECFNGLRDEAADEIERLRAEVAALRAVLSQALSDYQTNAPLKDQYQEWDQEIWAAIDAALAEEQQP